MRIYVASKVSHAARWKQLRENGWPIISTWIDEAGPGESTNLEDLWLRGIAEVKSANVVIAYRDPATDFRDLKGGYVEVGAALASIIPVFAIGFDGLTVAHHPMLFHFNTIEEALAHVHDLPTIDKVPEVVIASGGPLRISDGQGGHLNFPMAIEGDTTTVRIGNYPTPDAYEAVCRAFNKCKMLLDRYREQLIWASGAPAFQEGGEARIGFLKGMRPLLEAEPDVFTPDDEQSVLTFVYKNYRGEIATRHVLPDRLYYGSTEWHKEPQWLLRAFDIERREFRDFAVEDIAIPGSGIFKENARLVEAALAALWHLGNMQGDRDIFNKYNGRVTTLEECAMLLARSLNTPAEQVEDTIRREAFKEASQLALNYGKGKQGIATAEAIAAALLERADK